MAVYNKNRHKVGTKQHSGGARSASQPKIYEQYFDSPAAASTTGVHAAITDTGAAQTITTSITSPTIPRNISATAGGVAGDIKAISVTVTGTDYYGATQTEAIGPFTVNNAGTVYGSKAFATVTSIALPKHDGTGATTSIGWSDKLGLDMKMKYPRICYELEDDAVVGTAGTVVGYSTGTPNGTYDPNSACDGSKTFRVGIAYFDDEL